MWRSLLGIPLQTDHVPMTLGPTWTDASAHLTAPLGTLYADVNISGHAPVSTLLYFDDLVIDQS